MPGRRNVAIVGQGFQQVAQLGFLVRSDLEMTRDFALADPPALFAHELANRSPGWEFVHGAL
jgi:hypothetical protein